MKTLFNSLNANQQRNAIKKIVDFNNGLNLPIFVTCTNDIIAAIVQGYNMDKHFIYTIISDREINFSVKKTAEKYCLMAI